VRHLALGAEQADERVARGLEDAAAAARARGAWETAGDLLEQARALTPTSSRAPRGCAGCAPPSTTSTPATARGRAALLEAILEDTPPGPTRSDALRLLAEVRFNEQGFAGIVPLLEEALGGRRRPGARDRDRAGPHLRPLQPQRQRPRRRRARRPALALAEGADDPPLLAQALAAARWSTSCSAAGSTGRWSTAQVALEGGDRAVPLYLQPSSISACLKLWTGRYDEARAELTGAAEGPHRVGRRERPRLPAVLGRGARARRRRPRRAGALADEAEVHAALAGSEFNRAWALAQRALVMAHRGDVEATRTAAPRRARSARASRPATRCCGWPARSA
jgi:hypothetical protein